jgi:superfamily II DNA or RNA helicase
MNSYTNTLIQSLQTGFIDQSIQSNKEYRPQLLVNDNKSGKKVLTTLDRELKFCDEFWFSVAFITTSGIAAIISKLVELERKGIRGKILTSQYLNFTQPEALRRIKNFKNIELRISTEGSLHSKGYFFRKGDVFNLIIGSSNLTADALCSNKEWNLKVTAAPKSELSKNAFDEFEKEFNKAIPVTDEFIETYEKLYLLQKKINVKTDQIDSVLEPIKIHPNLMQTEALENINFLRSNYKEKALLISATGTGKTYLSAFDVKAFKPKTFLFVVHRQTIAREAMKTYKQLFGTTKTMGFYSGNQRELEADFVFSTVQTISKTEHLSQFHPERFDYIVIDETHRAGAESYKKIMDYFTPKFLLGMTATPERTDGFDIFKLFDYNIAYEIRLHQALSENMLSPFHYYGITDLTVDNQVIEETSDFNLLTTDERVNRVIEKAKFYGTDDGNIRGLIFCSRKEECQILSEKFNEQGYKTIALTGDDDENKRVEAINKLESKIQAEKLDYIFTVDIFNEGIDIPKVNQIIMLRPTQSAIIFVQQLGRGLRKAHGKEYLTVIDFIGNYSNNYMVPIALYGDTTYNKDTLRNLLSTGSQLLPGTSTVNFDQITKERIFAAIDSANMRTRKDLIKDYTLLKFKLGRIPMMVDFLDHGSRDPFLFASPNKDKSYFNFVQSIEDELDGKINEEQKKCLELFSTEVNNGKRVEESIILKELLANEVLEIKDLNSICVNKYGHQVSDADVLSYIRNINFDFTTQSYNNELTPVSKIYNLMIVEQDGSKIKLHQKFKQLLSNEVFVKFLSDNIDCAIKTYDSAFEVNKYDGGFILYKKYSRKDVFRILNWATNPIAQNVGGYIISSDKSNCPVFVNYQKHENISSTTKYEDIFLNNQEFQYMSKSKRTLNSPDVSTIRKNQNGLRMPLFIKKSNDEGIDFYYMGDMTPKENLFEQTTMPNDDGNPVSVVKMIFILKHPVVDYLYDYLMDTTQTAMLHK